MINDLSEPYLALRTCFTEIRSYPNLEPSKFLEFDPFYLNPKDIQSGDETISRQENIFIPKPDGRICKPAASFMSVPKQILWDFVSLIKP